MYICLYIDMYGVYVSMAVHMYECIHACIMYGCLHLSLYVCMFEMYVMYARVYVMYSVV